MKKNIVICCLMVACIFLMTACSSDKTLLKPYVPDDTGVDLSNLNMFVKRLDGVSSGSLVILSDDNYPINDIEAPNAFLIEMDTQNVILSKQSLITIPAGNFTKLMTAYVVFKSQIAADRKITITQDIFSVKNDLLRCKFTKDDTVTVSDLLYGLLLHCGNDVAIPLAISSCGSVSQFVKEMNTTAKTLCLNQSRYSSVYGYTTNDSKQETSLYDIYRLVEELREEPLFMDIIGTQSYRCKYSNHLSEPAGTSWNSALPFYNDELDYVLPEGLLLKGGMIEAAAYQPSQMMVMCSDVNGKNYLALVAGCTSYEQCCSQMQKLLEKIVLIP